LQDYCKGDDANRVLAYYYFDFRDPQKQKASNLLRSLISDLCPITCDLPEDVRKLYDDYRRKKTPSNSELRETFLSVVRSSGQTYIVIDALDECGASSQGREPSSIQDELDNQDGLDELLSILSELIDLGASHLHLLVTSRDGQSAIDEKLTTKIKLDDNRYDVILHEKVDGDIVTLIESKVNDKRYLRDLNPELKTQVASSLKEKAKGMYVKITSQILNMVDVFLILSPGFG
jgi:hypothetical protein